MHVSAKRKSEVMDAYIPCSNGRGRWGESSAFRAQSERQKWRSDSRNGRGVMKRGCSHSFFYLSADEDWWVESCTTTCTAVSKLRAACQFRILPICFHHTKCFLPTLWYHPVPRITQLPIQKIKMPMPTPKISGVTSMNNWVDNCTVLFGIVLCTLLLLWCYFCSSLHYSIAYY